MGTDRTSSISLKILDERQQSQVWETLQAMLASPIFSSARRSKRFLAYIVEKALQGKEDELKERVIGLEVFDRSPIYSTGDDPIVRVQAVDLRRRLDRYNQSAEAQQLPVLITLSTGGYCPRFIFDQASEAIPEITSSETAIATLLPDIDLPVETSAARVDEETPTPAVIAAGKS